MRVVGGLGIVVGLALLLWRLPASQGQWAVTVGDEPPRTVTVVGDETVPTLLVFARSVSEGSPRADAGVRVGVGLAAIALGVVAFLKARDTSPWIAA